MAIDTITVERLTGRMQVDLKSSEGPEPVLDWLEATSEAMAIEEAGVEVTPEFLIHLSHLRELAVPLLRGGLS